MVYQIECVVQEVELAVNCCVSALKIKGTEGYLLKQGSEEYNVFCPKKMPKKDEPSGNATILNVGSILRFAVCPCYGIAQILTQSMTAKTKVRLHFKDFSLKENGDEDSKYIELSLISITLI